jgi:ArsR family transcriptional regulator, arsenate/arsenite/antimonite-responsive transcriptional repressor
MSGFSNFSLTLGGCFAQPPFLYGFLIFTALETQRFRLQIPLPGVFSPGAFMYGLLMEMDDAVVALFALAHLKAPANTTSTHLSILTGAGLLKAYRSGRSIIYSAELTHLSGLADYLLNDCAQGKPEAWSQLTVPEPGTKKTA